MKLEAMKGILLSPNLKTRKSTASCYNRYGERILYFDEISRNTPGRKTVSVKLESQEG
jgi:hypothetical protein